MLRISAFTHASLIGLEERFLALCEMTVRESLMSPSLLVSSHQSLVTSHSFLIAYWISSSDFTSTEEMNFLNFSSCSAMSGASGGNWGSIFFSACSVICETT